jgi:hypothetical protein
MNRAHPERTDAAMSTPEPIQTTRRTFVFLGMLALAGCATGRSQQALRSPDPIWPDMPPEPGVPSRTAQMPAPPAPRGPEGAAPAAGASTPAGMATLRKGPVPFALARQTWARGVPVYSKLNPMLPPKWITVHHDGMDPYFGTDIAEVKVRLDTIRNGALSRGDGWGDIPYHFVVDRSGRVWEGRQMRFQGAHVKYCNENNIGVMCLGNFEEQQPSAAQIAGLERTLTALRAYYRLPMSRVRTHREWPTAHTECPGTNLQARMVALRKGATAA